MGILMREFPGCRGCSFRLQVWIIPQWHLRFGIKPKNKTIRRLSFVWRRLADSSGKAEDTITVRNAAGIAQAQVRADSNSAQLITPQKTTRAQTAESLTARAFGMPLPLQVLGDFLGGDNDAVRIFREKMRQLGWRVRFAADDADGLPLRFGADGDRGSIDIAITGRQ